VAQATEWGRDTQYSALTSAGSTSPIFPKEVRCPKSSIFPRESPPTKAGCLSVGVGGVLAASDTSDSSCLRTLKNPIFFLIATARVLSPLTAYFCSMAPCLPPPTHPRSPHSCLSLPTPRSPVSGRTIYHVCSREGPGLPDEIVLSEADDRLWEQQLELRKEVSPLS
jgi:hypothetical protein